MFSISQNQTIKLITNLPLNCHNLSVIRISDKTHHANAHHHAINRISGELEPAEPELGVATRAYIDRRLYERSEH